MTEFRYKAFVSYSWADAEWGKWLLQAIETYRTPAALVGKDGAGGPVPARLQPLFKDREEEAAGASIGNAVETALASSEFLIVICSPRSAQSRWVDHEIAWFKTHRDPAKILALIVDGDPGSGDAECFPRALTHCVAADRTITDEPVDAPLAADARISGDGKRRAKLKLAAAMLGVGLDELVNRDERRRTIRTRIVVGASLALATVMTGMAWAAVVARNEADHQRAESDGLVEFMLTDLRKRLEPVGRLDALDVVGQRALTYYAGQKASSLDANALGRRARALHLVGEVSNIRGDSVGGLAAFRQAAATTGEQLARDPNNPQRIFDHAQSVFWVGAIAYERGEAREAEAQFKEYKRLADRLVEIDPKKPEWQMEVSYAESNLGVLFLDQGRYAEADRAFARGLEKIEDVARHEKPNSARQLDIGQQINWLGKARTGTGLIADALAQHQREIAIYQEVLRKDPVNSRAKWLLAVAWQHIGGLLLEQGQVGAGAAAYGNSLALMKQLRAIEPRNTEWQETEVRAMIWQADGLFYQGHQGASAALIRTATVSLERMIAADPANTIWSVDLRSHLQLQIARAKLFEGNAPAALELANETIRRNQAVGKANAERAISLVKAQIIAGDALQRMGRNAEATARWQMALDNLTSNPSSSARRWMRLQFTLLKRLGRPKEAAQIATTLDRQGDRSPAYLREKMTP